MNEPASLNSTVSVRVTASVVKKFNERCCSLGNTPSLMFRELMTAFSEGRVMIKKTKQDKTKGDLYVD